jgi:hypothetical protein
MNTGRLDVDALRELGDRIDQVFAIVQHQENAFVLEKRADAGDGRARLKRESDG